MDTLNDKHGQFQSEINVDETCEHCHQSIYTTSSLNKGVVSMLSAMFKFVEEHDKNVFHPEKELLQQGYISANMRGNVSHLGNHGLIAKHTEAGNWLLTPKASKFIKGNRVPKVAVIEKATKHTIGYLSEMTTYGEIMTNTDVYWYQPSIEITDGGIVRPDYQPQATLL